MKDNEPRRVPLWKRLMIFPLLMIAAAVGIVLGGGCSNLRVEEGLADGRSGSHCLVAARFLPG